MRVGADLGRDKISSLVLTELARGPKLYGVAESGWKLAGTVKGGGTMKRRYKLAAVHNEDKSKEEEGEFRKRGEK